MIMIYPKCEDWRLNYILSWPRSTNFLGNILLWAYRAKAIRVHFSSEHLHDLMYTDRENVSVETELGPAPPNALTGFIQYCWSVSQAVGIRAWFRPKIAISVRTLVERQVVVCDLEQRLLQHWTMKLRNKEVDFEFRSVSPLRSWRQRFASLFMYRDPQESLAHSPETQPKEISK